ncbi:diguanylate cyclase [Candidatus Electronema sp. JM]|uniref:diguanylate cyclase n=1 Tax=Candidatus Electronema sp. JM TaxID=3401571 RepID=UPI003AA95D37
MISRILNQAASHCRRQQGKLPVRLSVGRTLRKNKKLLICLTLVILLVNATFLGVIFYTFKKELSSSLLDQAKRHEEEFKLNLKMVYSSMLQMSTLISSSKFSQAFLLESNKAANASPTEPSSISQPTSEEDGILRKTYQFGQTKATHLQPDAMQNYTWQRGVLPLWVLDPASGEKVYVGSLEISTSFKDIVPLYAKLFRIDAAALLNKDYVRSKMWTDQTKKYFEEHIDANHYIEVTSSREMMNEILAELFIRSDYKVDDISLMYKKSAFYSVYYFPLPDAQENELDAVPTLQAGFMLIWEDVTEQVRRTAKTFAVYVGLSALGFVLIEIGLIWMLNRENRLYVAEQCAAIDELTGLYNRRYFDELLENELRRADLPLSLIICDVDYFKRYNDTYGHKAGDECLKKIADSLKGQARRSSDCVARYGGEEFVIVLPRTDLHSAADIAEGARRAIVSLAIPHISSDIVPVITVTLGVACTANLAEYDNLFEAADRNLYLAKNNGRNRVEPSKVVLPPRRTS